MKDFINPHRQRLDGSLLSVGDSFFEEGGMDIEGVSFSRFLYLDVPWVKLMDIGHVGGWGV
jgi:hypothetical protein